MSLARILAGEVTLLLRTHIKLHLRTHRKQVWYSESKVNLGKLIVLCHRLKDMPSF
jgi:hypothetical protein